MVKLYLETCCSWNYLAVQWLGFCASTAGGMGLNPDQGTKILQATWRGQEKKNFAALEVIIIWAKI